MSNTKPLKDVFQSMIDHYKMKDHFKVAQVKSFWEDMVGAYIVSYTEKISIRNHILYVKIQSPELRNELQYAKGKLKQNINNQLGENFIHDIKIQ